jgi:di/tricarboxylate transporter
MGRGEDIMRLRESKDLLLLEWSSEEIHSGKKAKHAGVILTSVVLFAAFGIVPIAISAFVGATTAILAGCLNLRQARRAIDSQVVLIVAASLALGAAMQATGGAKFIAQGLVQILDGAPPFIVMSVLFGAMVVVTNILSNNASAVLFTPIAVGAAIELNVPPEMFIFAVIFACNCSFITPIGYQTNLLVMGPGHYKFIDFIKAGLPLAILMWITYSIFASYYFQY